MKKALIVKIAMSVATAILLGTSALAYANITDALQQSKKQISGVVTDNAGEPVIGASVMVPNTTIGVVTDLNGRYTLYVPESATTLEVSCIGYVTKALTIGAEGTYDAVLDDDSLMLAETVVIGYGTQKKVNLTGSVSAVDFQTVEAKSRPITDATQALANVAPGLQIMQSSGQPNGESFGISIRGTGTLNSSSPLVLIDGIEQSIGTVNPSDIATISVLKDAASCAIYGNRGANGVILITTKNGSSNGKVSIDFDANWSVAQPFKLIHQVSDYADYMEAINESFTNMGNSPQYSEATINQWREAKKSPNALAQSGYPNYVAYPNTDWLDAIYKTSIVQKYAVTVSGKEKKAGYTLSFGYTNNPGIIDNTGFSRFNGRANLYIDVTKWLRAGVRAWGNVTDQDVNSLSLASLSTQKLVPGTYPFYDGKYGAPETNEEDPQSHNALWDFNGSTGYDNRTHLTTDWYAQVKFLKHFTYNFDFYYDDARREKKTAPVAVGKFSFSQDVYTTGADDPSTLYTYMYYTRTNNYKLNHLLNYSQSFGKHDVAAMAGYEQQKYDYRQSDISKLGLTDATISDFDAATTPYSSKGYGTCFTARSWFGRVNYAFDGKYLFEANFRYDGSSRFAPNYRWGFFPSASGAWRISKENFMKNLTAVSDLKLRVSYGKLGNNSIGNYDWQPVYSTANYASGNSLVSGIAITSIANGALRWEETAVANLGLDFGFLNNRLTGTVDLYNKITSGILYTPDMFMVMGNAAAPKQNIAEVTNRGVEFELGWKDSIGKDFSYSINANFSYNKNWVSKYKGKLNADKSNLGDVSTGGTNRVLEDHMINEFYLPTVYKGTGNGFAKDGIKGGPKDGMIRTTSDMDWLLAMQENGYSFQPSNAVDKGHLWYGEYIYADNNGDGIYGSSLDAEFQGTSTTPKWNYGLQASLYWKNLDFSMNWGGAAGFTIYYYGQSYNSTSVVYGYALPAAVVADHYFFDPENPDNPKTNLTSKNSRLINNTSNPTSATTALHLEKGDFLKLRNLTIGYTLPEKWTNKLQMQKLRVYVSGENLFAITGFSGMDPEQRIGSIGYSTMRQFAFGVNVTF